MKTKSSSAAIHSEPLPAHIIGSKALFLEPLLILASSIFWLAVLPFAGLFCSGSALWKLVAVHAQETAGSFAGANAHHHGERQYQLHYEESLATAGEVLDYQRASWIEDRR